MTTRRSDVDHHVFISVWLEVQLNVRMIVNIRRAQRAESSSQGF